MYNLTYHYTGRGIEHDIRALPPTHPLTYPIDEGILYQTQNNRL